MTTKRPAGGPAYKGGVSTWARIAKEIQLLLRNSGLELLTTMLAYYGFPTDAPGMADRPPGSPLEAVAHVEHSLTEHFKDQRLVPHLILHETESWVFAARTQIGQLYENYDLTAKLQADVDAAGGVEMVNDGPSNAPSKRLKHYCPVYVKRIDGPLAIADLGIEPLRAQCPHLDSWLRQLMG